MKNGIHNTIKLNGRQVDYRLVRSKTAHRLRIRVGVGGVEVVQPVARSTEDLDNFLKSNQNWIVRQIDRAKRIGSVRKTATKGRNEILLRGVLTPVHVEKVMRRRGTNKVIFAHGTLSLLRGMASRTAPVKTLENWLRQQARFEIHRQLEVLAAKLRRFPRRVYIMGQRTKWGNCSSLQNLSFNWRLIMAPEFVIRYLVTHEAVHLKIPDHSKRFWLTVQSFCSEMERAKQWLRTNGDKIMVDLNQLFFSLTSCPKKSDN